MKSAARNFIAKMLWSQVKRLRSKNELKVVAVAGSVGKTSTKLATVKLLEQKYRVQYQDGNYNDLVSVPLIFFGQSLPSLFNPFAWLIVLLKNEVKIWSRYEFGVVVIELGVDAPGQLAEFKSYLKADLGILTAVAPEHMEYFKDLDAVAKEELYLAELVEKMVASKDLVEEKYIKQLTNSTITYSVNKTADINFSEVSFNGFESSFVIVHKGKNILQARHELITEPQLHSVAGAVAVALELGVSNEQISKGLANIKPVAGRMNKLEGVNGSIIIDDTYNASPEAMKAALQTLYRLTAPQKIAILGNMNELGEFSQLAHKEIGRMCDPTKVGLVVTIGPDANSFLAPAAKEKGCEVQTFNDPYSAGEFVRKQLKNGTIVLVKGSQNKVFAEEAVKLLLANPEDFEKLVRQSSHWLKRKQQNFSNL